MVNQEDVDITMALKQSMPQHESPEPKRSKPMEISGAGGESESPEAAQRRKQRELMAAAAEKRMAASKSAFVTAVKSAVSGKDVKFEENQLVEAAVENAESVRDSKVPVLESSSSGKGVNLEKMECSSGNDDASLSVLEAEELFLMIFGNGVTKDVLAQWTNQGIRFSDDPETSLGLVQHEGGPCGVLAAIQLETLEKHTSSIFERRYGVGSCWCTHVPARSNPSCFSQSLWSKDCFGFQNHPPEFFYYALHMGLHACQRCRQLHARDQTMF